MVIATIGVVRGESYVRRRLSSTEVLCRGHYVPNDYHYLGRKVDCCHLSVHDSETGIVELEHHGCILQDSVSRFLRLSSCRR